MSKDYGLTGVGSPLEVTKGGAKLKNNSGVLESRNNADDAYAILRAADGSASNDVVNKGQLDAAVASDSFSTVAGDSGSAIADSATDTLTIVGGTGIGTVAADDPETVTINVSDAGITETQLNASVAGDGLDGGAGSALSVDITDLIDTDYGLTESLNNLMVNLESDSGMQFDAINGGIELKPDSTTGATVAPLTVGANGAGVTVDNDTIEHSTGTLSVKDGMRYRKVDFAYDTSSPFNIGDALPVNAIVIGWMVQVDTTFDGTTPTLSIGDSGDADGIATTAQIDLESAGLNVGDAWVDESSTQVTGTLTVSGASQGAGSLMIKFIV